MDSRFASLVRREFDHLRSIYFNSAYFGPSPLRAKREVQSALGAELDPSFSDDRDWMGIPEVARYKMGKLLGLPADNIFHSTSTSDIVNIVANGYPFSEGDVVCALDGDYPSNVLPWMLAEQTKPFTFKLLGPPQGKDIPTGQWLANHLPPRCRIFCVSHVAFDSGKRADLISLGTLCRERDILFVVDATQSIGGLFLDQKELNLIDVLAVSSYKWMLGPYGHAFGHLSDKALARLARTHANWIHSPDSRNVYNLTNYTTDTLPGARRFDRGQVANFLACACLEGGIDLLAEAGQQTVEQHNKATCDHFLEHYPTGKYDLITPREAMGNILSLAATATDPVRLEKELKSRNIDVSVREGKLRLSFHLFNTKEQVEELIKALDTV